MEEEISKMLGTEQLRTECSSLQYEQLKQVWERTLISIAKYSWQGLISSNTWLPALVSANMLIDHPEKAHVEIQN